jgi:hypothetical protein
MFQTVTGGEYPTHEKSYSVCPVVGGCPPELTNRAYKYKETGFAFEEELPF